MSKRSYMEGVVEGLRAVRAVDVDFATHNLDARIPTNSAAMNDACHGTTRKKIYVRLLLSIDRRETTEAAMETVCQENCNGWFEYIVKPAKASNFCFPTSFQVKLALEMRDLGVVGIDLSGNPVVGNWFFLNPSC